MKDTPILYTGPMVRAVQADRNTMTRRVVKARPDRNLGSRCVLQPHELAGEVNRGDYQNCPYGIPGDRLWVKETHYAWGHWTKRYNAKKRREEWHFVDETIGTGKAYRYAADEQLPRRKRELHEVGWWKRPAIFMPRAASRISLEVTAVRIERLQAITPRDAVAEGLQRLPASGRYVITNGDQYMGFASTDPVEVYRDLWEGINGTGSWAVNPSVWVISFKRVGAA